MARQSTSKPTAPETPTSKGGVAMSDAHGIYELRDKDTGFSDLETGFEIRRAERVELTGEIGDATQRAIKAGRIVKVDEPIEAPVEENAE